MAQLEELIRRLNQLVVPGQDKGERYKAAEALWQYSSYENELTDDRVRNDYVLALFGVANAFSSERAIAALKRAYSIDRGHFDYGVKASAKEYAAHRIGKIYEDLGSYHTAACWFRRSLQLAQSVGIRNNTLGNLGALGRTLEFLSLHEQSGQYYDQVLSMLASSPPEADDYLFLIPAAMHHLLHGDQARGETLLREWIAAHLGESASHSLQSTLLEPWAYEALHYLGMHYVATGRPQDALNLAETLEPYTPVDAKGAHHALVTRAFLQLGQLDRALEELAHIHDVDSPRFARGGFHVQSLELWIDTARIHAAKHDYDKAIAAYVVLAYDIGGLVANTRAAPTVRLRFYWLQQMAYVVHEMVSVWITIADTETRSRHEATVGNALLQLKGNLFIAVGFHRGPFGSVEHQLFDAVRKYAAAARKVMSRPEDQDAIYELEEVLRERERVERGLATAEIFPSPAVSGVLARDFRESQILTPELLLLDYSLVRYQPPRNGMAGPVQGSRYISVGLTAGRFRVNDLGEAEQIDKLCRSLIQAFSTQPTDNDGSSSDRRNRRHLRLADSDDRQQKPIDHHDLAKRVYERIVAPLEPLPRSLLVSADGMLAALPFQALILEDDRYLVEDRDVTYCYSLLSREAQSFRQVSSSTAVRPPVRQSALLLGDPTYTTSNLAPLAGTKIEVTEVAKGLRARLTKGDSPLNEVRVKTGTDATVSQLRQVYQPAILHIAAHGTFDKELTRLDTSRAITFGRHYRWWQHTQASSIDELDRALLRSVVLLADDSEEIGDPANGAVLTALELGSLNLTFTTVVLSACETGVGDAQSGAGVLGFQYGVLAAGAKAALLSLWKVLDRETSRFMIDFYQYQSDRSAKAAYLAAARKHCRKKGILVHPYYWAAFVFVDQEH